MGNSQALEALEPDSIELGATSSELISAEVDMQVSTAKRYPRSLKRFREETLTMATLDSETAQECTYSIPRAGKFIVGPSIRFAEILASAWGNIREEKASLEPGPNDRVVVGMGTVWDMERNRLVRAKVSRRITTKSGGRFGDDMISTTANAAASIAHRNAILACIPRGLWKDIHAKVMDVAAGDGQTIAETRRRWFDFWAARGVEASRVLAALRKPSIEDVDLGDCGILVGLATALKDGTLDVDQAFPVQENPAAAAAPGRRRMSFGSKAESSPKDLQEAHRRGRPERPPEPSAAEAGTSKPATGEAGSADDPGPSDGRITAHEARQNIRGWTGSVDELVARHGGDTRKSVRADLASKVKALQAEPSGPAAVSEVVAELANWPDEWSFEEAHRAHGSDGRPAVVAALAELRAARSTEDPRDSVEFTTRPPDHEPPPPSDADQPGGAAPSQDRDQDDLPF